MRFVMYKISLSLVYKIRIFQENNFTMRKTLTIGVIGLAAVFISHAQDSSETAPATYEQCSFFMKTPPLRDLLETIEPIDDSAYYANHSAKPVNPMRYNIPENLTEEEVEALFEEDPTLQTINGSKTNGGYRLQINVDGQFGAFPPDPTGAAGIDYFVQSVDSTYRIYEKEDGSSASGVYFLNSLWDDPGDGDPIVMYDRYAERWFISQFYGAGGAPYGVQIAISTTTDPLGEYYLYQFDYTLFPDYPKYSVWSNAYFMSANVGSADCSAFERDKMLVGDPTAGVIKMNFPTMPLIFNSIAPAYAEGAAEPDADEPCYFFAVQDNGLSGISTDHIKVMKAEVDWDNPETSSVTVSQELNTAPFNALFAGTWTEYLTQKGSSQKLDAIPGIFMYRAQYRRFGDYNTVVLCHNVNVGGNRAGQRWYELRDNDDGNWSIYQQGTYALADNNNRWLGSVSMDVLGNIAMCYSFTGPDHHPGIRYTGRFDGDPLNEMTVPELTAVEGEGAQTLAGRYGDYSQMSMDPTDDYTFWFTGQYLGTGGSRKTRIISFSSWNIAVTEEAEIRIAAFNAYQPAPDQLMLKWKDVDPNEEVRIEVYEMSGKRIITEKISGDHDQVLVNLPKLVKGIYVIKFNSGDVNLTKRVHLGW